MPQNLALLLSSIKMGFSRNFTVQCMVPSQTRIDVISLPGLTLAVMVLSSMALVSSLKPRPAIVVALNQNVILSSKHAS